jgi:hypothetical protein
MEVQYIPNRYEHICTLLAATRFRNCRHINSYGIAYLEKVQVLPNSMPRRSGKDKTTSKLDPSVEIQVPDPGECCCQSCKAIYQPPHWGSGQHSNWIVCVCSQKYDHKAWWAKHFSESDAEARWVDIEDFVNLLCHPSWQHSFNATSVSIGFHHAPYMPTPFQYTAVYIYIDIYTYITYGHIYKATVWTCLDPYRYDWLGEILSQLLSLRTLG